MTIPGEAAKPHLNIALDGTLIRGDRRWEARLSRLVAAVAAVRDAALRRPRPGPGGFDPAALPYRAEVLGWLAEERAAGRKIVLVAPEGDPHAAAIAAHLGLFDEVIHGGEGDPETRDRFAGRRFDVRAAVRAIRPHQWAKNALLAVPVITAHRVRDASTLAHLSEAFVSLSLVASSVYLLNDLVDLKNDRAHPRKKDRPLASGRLGIPAAVAMGAALLAGGFAVGATLPAAFLGWLAFYWVATNLYSFELKKRPLIDVMTLAGLYTTRILAGGAATGIVVSKWLLAFSMFIFVSLAFAKRYTEMREAAGADGRLAGRGYSAEDAEMIRVLGAASGYMAVLVLALYFNDPEVIRQYRRPGWVWLICPIFLYWISRLWLLAHRGRLHHDPVVFALRDRISYVVGALIAGIMAASKVF